MKLFLQLFIILSFVLLTSPFNLPPPTPNSFSLQASKKPSSKKPKLSSKSFSGFGSPSSTSKPKGCPCGSPLSYSDCTCSSLHSSLTSTSPPTLSSQYSSFLPSSIVKSRFSAYSIKLIPYIIKSTSSNNEQHYLEDYELWKSRLEQDCFDNYDLISCQILEEDTTIKSPTIGEESKVKFKASMRVKGESRIGGFIESSVFRYEDIGGGVMGWLYMHGDVEGG